MKCLEQTGCRVVRLLSPSGVKLTLDSRVHQDSVQDSFSYGGVRERTGYLVGKGCAPPYAATRLTHPAGFPEEAPADATSTGRYIALEPCAALQCGGRLEDGDEDHSRKHDEARHPRNRWPRRSGAGVAGADRK